MVAFVPPSGNEKPLGPWTIYGEHGILYTECQIPRETVSFVFPRVLMFPETKSRETSGLEGKQN